MRGSKELEKWPPRQIKSREIIRVITLRFMHQQRFPLISRFFAEITSLIPLIPFSWLFCWLQIDYIPKRCGYQPCTPKQEQSRHQSTGKHRSVSWSESRTHLSLTPKRDTESGLRKPTILRNAQEIFGDIWSVNFYSAGDFPLNM